MCHCDIPIAWGKYYHIGSVTEWRTDPATKAVEVHDRRREAVYQQARARQHNSFIRGQESPLTVTVTASSSGFSRAATAT